MNERSNSLRPLRLGLSLGTFLVVAYFACLALVLIVPDLGKHWLQFLPGFTWTLQGILLGLVEVFAYGLFSGVVFAPIYNAFNVQGSD
jgi:uncharacterized protein DUF5676